MTSILGWLSTGVEGSGRGGRLAPRKAAEVREPAAEDFFREFVHRRRGAGGGGAALRDVLRPHGTVHGQRVRDGVRPPVLRKVLAGLSAREDQGGRRAGGRHLSDLRMPIREGMHLSVPLFHSAVLGSTRFLHTITIVVSQLGSCHKIELAVLP